MAKTLSFLSEIKHKTWKCPDTGIQEQNSQELLYSLSQHFPHKNSCSVIKLAKSLFYFLALSKMELVIVNTSLRLCFLNLLPCYFSVNIFKLLNYFSVNIFLILWWRVTSFLGLQFHTVVS